MGESRKIFRRVKSYVTYRFAATIQLIVFLSIVVFVQGCQIDLIYIVILALLNDLTMMPLSNDMQKASKVPDNPVVSRILIQFPCTELSKLEFRSPGFTLLNAVVCRKLSETRTTGSPSNGTTTSTRGMVITA